MRILQCLAAMPWRFFQLIADGVANRKCGVCENPIDGEGIETTFYGTVCSPTCYKLAENEPYSRPIA